MKKFMNGLVRVETFLAGAILVLLVVTTFCGVLGRYIFNSPFTWEEEVQLACMVWVTFLAAPVAFHTGSHVAIEILVDAFPKKLQKAAEYIIFVIVWAVLIYLFFRMIDYVMVIYSTGRATPILKIPYYLIYGIGPVSVVLMLLSYTYVTVTTVFKKDGSEEAEEVQK